MKTRQVVRTQVVVADHVVKGILKEAKDYDVVIMGASHEGVFQQILFGVVPEQVAKRCAKTVIMVKRSPGPHRLRTAPPLVILVKHKLVLPQAAANGKASPASPTPAVRSSTTTAHSWTDTANA